MATIQNSRTEEDCDTAQVLPLMYSVFTSPNGARCVREFYGERYVLVRVLPAYPSRVGWVRERELNPTALPALTMNCFPGFLPPVRSARVGS